MIELIGSGRLHDAIHIAVAPLRETVSALILATDSASTNQWADAREQGVPWLPVRVDSGCVLIGPMGDSRHSRLPNLLPTAQDGSTQRIP